jgi:hypothetical protein
MFEHHREFDRRVYMGRIPSHNCCGFESRESRPAFASSQAGNGIQLHEEQEVDTSASPITKPLAQRLTKYVQLLKCCWLQCCDGRELQLT